MSSESDYPPNGLADSVKKLPEWIQKVRILLLVCSVVDFEVLTDFFRAVVTTNTSVKKKVPLSSGVICQPSAQIFLSTIHSSLRI